MYSIINCTYHQIYLKLRKEGRWVAWSCRMNVTDMHTGLWEIFNHNEQSTLLLGTYKYTKLQTRRQINCCYGWLNSLSHTLLPSHCSNSISISTVVMLGFWLCQFNTGSLAWELCLSSSTKFFLWVFKFSICSLGYGWWSLRFELHRVVFVPL